MATALGCPRDEPRVTAPTLQRVGVQLTTGAGLDPAAWAAELAEVASMRTQAAARHREGRWPEAIAQWRALLARTPDHVGHRYNLACALAQHGDDDAAMAELATLTRMQVALPAAEDPELAGLHGHARWGDVIAAMASATAVRGRSSHRALPLPDFFGEGLAIDDGTTFVGGIVGQGIARITGDRSAPFAATPGGWSVLGLAIDRDHDRLVAAASAMPQGRTMPTDVGKAGIFAFDLADGQPRGAWVTDDGGAHLFGDLTIATDGTVLTTDTLGGGVLAVTPGASRLHVVVPAGTMPSPQGLASFDRDTLLVADYAAGLVAIDLDDDGVATRMRTLPPPADRTLRGVDGLALRGTTLAAVRNGIAPWSVQRVELAPDATSIVSVETWVVADPALGEPTLVTVDADALHVMHTDSWDRVFDAQGRPRPGVAIAVPHVVSTPWVR
jgi:hypothetical protein